MSINQQRHPPEMYPAVGSARNQRSTISGISQSGDGSSMNLEGMCHSVRTGRWTSLIAMVERLNCHDAGYGWHSSVLDANEGQLISRHGCNLRCDTVGR